MATPALLAPGMRPVKLQILLEALRTVGTGVALLAVGHVLAAAFAPDGATPNGPVGVGGTPTGWIVAGLVGALLAAATDAGSTAVQGRAQKAEEKRLRRALLAKAFGLGPARFTGAEAGRLVSMMTDSVERVTVYRQGFIGRLAGALLAPLLTLVLIAVTVDWLSALVLVMLLPVIPAAIGLFQKTVAGVSSASRETRMRLAGQYLEAIQGLPTLAGLRAADRIGDRLAAAGEDNRRAVMALLARNQLILFVTETVFSLFMVAAAGVLAWTRYDAGAIDLPAALALVLLSTLLTEPMTQIGAFFYIGMGGRAGQRQIVAFVEHGRVPAGGGHPGGRPKKGAKGGPGRPASGGHPGAATHPGGPGHPGRPAQPAPQPAPPPGQAPQEGAVVVRGAEFAYEAGRPVFTDLDLTVAEGGQTALLGASGSGKSTLLNVLAGDLVPTAGRAWVNGVPVTAGTQDQVRAASAVVQQQTWLFRASLAENLRVAASDATDAQLWEALAQVALDDWARTLPEGLDTPVGERGLAVSGGQAQRISLARAFLAGRPVVILDEPTSQVDLASEAVIEDAIGRITERATVILATHRPSLAPGRALRMDAGVLQEETR